MSKYTAEFKNIKDVSYLIEIETEKGNNNGTFLLSGDPLNSSMDSDGKTLYAPIKCTGMTVSILTKDMPLDLYSGSAMGTKVNVKENNKYIFKGYLTPCAYSMGFDDVWEEVQLECVDGISVLKEIPYESNNKDIETFINIIFKCLKKSNCFKTLYVTNTMQFSESANDAIFEKIRVSEGNFFEEKEYENQPDNDVAVSCYDVLYQIMQYMGCTIIADGEDVYILDYDAIRNGKNKYFKYDLSGATIGTKTETTLNHSYHIKEGSYAENGSKIDLTETFNKLTVIDDFYEIESGLEGVNETKNWVNVTSPEDSKLISLIQSGRYLENAVFTEKNKNGEDESFFCAVIKNWDGAIFLVYGKFFYNPMITTYHYSDSNNSVVSETTWTQNAKYSNLFTNAKGATLVGLFVAHIEKDKYNEWNRKFYNSNRPPQYIWSSLTNERKLSEFGLLCGMSDITQKKLTHYILCLNYDKSHIGKDDTTKYPYFTIKKEIPSVFGGADGYMVIKGSIIRNDDYESPFPQLGKSKRTSEEKTTVYKNESYIWSSLKWGDKYWQETSHFGTVGGDWVDTKQYFRIPYGYFNDEKKVNDWIDQDLEICNTAASVWGVNDEQGFYVPAPKSGNLTGNIELTIYANKDTNGKHHRDTIFKKDHTNCDEAFRPKVMLFKELDIKLGYVDDSLNDEVAKEDTVYSNEVTDYLNVNEGEDIECKICSFDNKTPSYSVTDYLDSSGKSQYVDKLFNQATNISLRPEEHIIYKTVNQYQEPKVKFEANLKNDIGFHPYSLLTDKTLSGRYFIIDTIQRDYRYNKANISMIEKNNRYN